MLTATPDGRTGGTTDTRRALLFAAASARCRICSPEAEGQGLCWHDARLLVEVGRAVDDLFKDKKGDRQSLGLATLVEEN